MIITVADQDKNLCRYARYAETPPYASGWQTFSYGKLGEVIENIRTFALPFENQTYTFKMQYKYDSYNRIQEMTYPDGEVVHYDYNRGGLLKKVYGTVKGDFLPQYPSTPHDSLVPLNLHGLGGQASLNSLPPVGDPVPLYDTHTYPYIDSIAYNEFELKSDVFYGNGTHALYAYDSLLRLLLLQSQTRTGDIMQDIVYTYDSVGNITGITNSAGMLPNGLGGTYNSAYTYDDLYRLTSSTGGWQGSQNISYRTTTLYRGNGRIKQKNLAARTLLNGVSDTVNYSHYYHYGNTSQPNTLTRYSSSVWDPGSWLGISNEEDSQFGWDAAGNMTESCIGGDRNCRSLCWDEQNRLQGVKDNKWLSYYQYDAAGDRTYKLTGKGELQNINGEWRYFYHLDNATLYVSPYLVATKQGYTKHYYAETERIASRIGGGRLRYLDQPVVGQGKIVEKQSTNKTYAKEVLEECLDAIHSEGQADLHHLYDMINSAHSETDCYWYHPDHLGSSSWITDSAGTAVQHLHYLPWGEDFVNQRLNSFDGVRYTFSAKEKDSETGLSYFGSRYYSSDLSVWLSVDPMAAKYPSLSPYVYCADNPVKFVDPNGEGVLPTDDLKANSSVSTLFSYANNNSVFRKVMNRYYTNISSVYIHLAQLKRAGVPTGRNNIARTEPYWSTDNPVGRYGIERIIINSDILNSAGEIAGDLTFVFGSLLHEAIHAKFIDIQQYDNALSNYPGYKDFIVDRPQDGGQHNQMAVYNRQTLIDGMKEFDMQTGNSHTDEWYEAVSWNGLQGTKAWQTFSNDNPELANKYLKIITSEINKLGVTGK